MTSSSTRTPLFRSLLSFPFLMLAFASSSLADPNVWTALGPPGAGVFSIAQAPSDPDTIYISMTGNNLATYGTTDGGATWHRLGAFNSFDPIRFVVSPTDSETVYTFSPYNLPLSRSTDGGMSWSNLHAGNGPVASIAIDPTNPSVIFAATQDDGLLKSVDGGKTWPGAGNFPFSQTFSADPIPAVIIDSSMPSRVYALEDHDVFRSLDGGTTWSDIRGDLPDSIVPDAIALDPSDSQSLYIAADEDGIFKTTDGGQHWTGPASGTGGIAFNALFVSPSDPSRTYAGTSESGLLQSIDSGTTWNPSTNLCSSTVGSLSSDPSDSTHLTLGGTGGYFESTDSGDTWTKRTAGLPDADMVAVAVDPTNPAHLFAAGYGSGLWETDNGGGNWNSLCSPSSNTNILSLAVDWTTATPRLYAGTEDGVFRSTDAGSSWSLSGLSGLSVGSITIDPSGGSLLIAGDNTGLRGNSLYYSTDGGDQWNVPAAGLPDGAAVCGIAIDPSDPSTAYVAWIARLGFDGGDVYKTSDGGVHWASTNVPNFPHSNSVAVDPEMPSNVYMTTDDNVYGSANSGGTWTPLARAVGAVTVDPADSDVLYLFSGGLSKSTDRGMTFQFISVPHSVAGISFDPSTPQRMYAAMTLGGVEVLDQVPAELDSLDPAIGSTNGGTVVTLHGSGFTGLPTVLIDGLPPTAISVAPTTITITMPPHAAGAVDVTVINAIGPPVTLSSAFTFECDDPFTAIVSGGGSYCATAFEAAAGIEAILTGVGPWTIQWSDGNIQQSDFAFASRDVSPASTTTYTITSVTDSSGCGPGIASGSATVTVTQPPATPAITAPLSVAPFSSVPFQASVPAADGARYQWSSDTGSIVDGFSANQVDFNAYFPGTVADLSVSVGDAQSCFSIPAVTHVPVDFLDVPPSNPFHDFVDAIAAHGVTLGCDGNGDYCPDDSVTREEMAAFIARAHDGGDAGVPFSGSVGGTPYDCNSGTSYFADVPTSDGFCRYVNRIAALGITIGCDPTPDFCPGDVVTREAMALFVGRALAPGAVPPSAYSDVTTDRSYDCSVAAPFSDVPANTASCNAIGYIWARGVVDGFGDGTFHPADVLTRAQGAKFISNGFDLRLGQ